MNSAKKPLKYACLDGTLFGSTTEKIGSLSAVSGSRSILPMHSIRRHFSAKPRSMICLESFRPCLRECFEGQRGRLGLS